MTLHCPQCNMQVGNATQATCAKHGPMVPLPWGTVGVVWLKGNQWFKP